jgi:hypothetical protein
MEVMRSAALVVAWIGAFLVPHVCFHLLKMFAIHKGWYIPQPAPSFDDGKTMESLREIRDVIRDINSKVGDINSRVGGRPQALTGTPQDLSQDVGRLT